MKRQQVPLLSFFVLNLNYFIGIEYNFINKLIDLFNSAILSSKGCKVSGAPNKVVNYFELGFIITDILKLCILALNNDVNSEKDKSKTSDVELILETIVSIFPLDEMSFWGMLERLLASDFYLRR